MRQKGAKKKTQKRASVAPPWLGSSVPPSLIPFVSPFLLTSFSSSNGHYTTATRYNTVPALLQKFSSTSSYASSSSSSSSSILPR